MTQIPTEGKMFEVKPLEIDRSIFINPMKDESQERIRRIIKVAFVEADKHPEKYASAFNTFIPAKDWEHYKNVPELKAYANDLGGVMTDWVEQALEWAQRICNGENWWTICNDVDTANWYRMVFVKDGRYWFVGGSRRSYDNNPASAILVIDRNCELDIRVADAVPLVTFKK